MSDFNENYFARGGLAQIKEIVAARITAGDVREFSGERVGAPKARPHQILCIGLNYSDHAAETGQTVPDEPILFMKARQTTHGPACHRKRSRARHRLLCIPPFRFDHGNTTCRRRRYGRTSPAIRLNDTKAVSKVTGPKPL